MAFTTPGTAVAGEVLTAAFWNEQVRDNMISVAGPPFARNLLYNGAMDLWQRGTTAASGYLADRWFMQNTTTISRSSDTPNTSFPYSMSFGNTAASYPLISQRIEGANSRRLVGQSVTLSFWAKNVSGTSALLASVSTANALDNFSAVTEVASVSLASSVPSTWTYYKTTFSSVIPANGVNGIEVRIIRDVSSAATTLVTGIQLEAGTVATQFEFLPFGEELARCQRYYFRPVGITTFASYATGFTQTTSIASFWLNLPVPMRVAPTSVGFSTLRVFEAGGTSSAVISIALNSPTNILAAIDVTVSAVLTTTRSTVLQNNNNAAGYLELSAEL